MVYGSEVLVPEESERISIEDEMRKSYLDYAMSTIVGRALPDVRDGLKPVHRRIVYAMNESGYVHSKPFRKSARIIGEVMGKYHPHGDSAIYDAMVRMAQNFSMGVKLVDGQGNFGSMDGDAPAAMRYTEARLSLAAHALVEDIDFDTVDFQSNYDESLLEPTVVPARYPNLLVNGSSGIAVGMATNIPPHNLGEVLDACCALVDNPELSVEDIYRDYVFGPDFPTGGQIMGRSEILRSFQTGRGSVKLRGKASVEEIRKGRMAIIVTEVPYQVNKAKMIEKIAELIRDKRLEGISDLRDESDRHGIRIVIEVKKDANAEVVLNHIYNFTALQGRFSANMLALNHGRPMLMNIKEILDAFLAFREQVIRRRTIYLLNKARARAHSLVGLSIAVANVDEIVGLIRTSKDPQEAKERLSSKLWDMHDIEPLVRLLETTVSQIEGDKYRLSDLQIKAILDLRLQRLTGLERDKVIADLKQISIEIQEYLDLLNSRANVLAKMKEEFLEIREKFAVPRRTEIIDSYEDIDMEDLIQEEEVAVTLSNAGYIKRVPTDAYRSQKRGGRGKKGMNTRDEDFVIKIFVLNTHQPVLFFSSIGKVYKMKVWQIPQGSPQSQGRALVNLLPLSSGETITTIMPMPRDESVWNDLYAVFATSSGDIRRNSLADFFNINANGKIAMKLEEGEFLIGVRTFFDDEDIFIATKMGKVTRFSLDAVRVFKSRGSTGVRAIKLAKGDAIISLCGVKNSEKFTTEQRDEYMRYANAQRRGEEVGGVDLSEDNLQEFLKKEEFILTITSGGMGKRTSSWEYRCSGRGGQGITGIKINDDEEIVACTTVKDDNDIILVSEGGQVIRFSATDIRVAGRVTQGVRVFKSDDKIVSVSILDTKDEEEDISEDDINNIDTAVEDGISSDLSNDKI